MAAGGLGPPPALHQLVFNLGHRLVEGVAVVVGPVLLHQMPGSVSRAGLRHPMGDAWNRLCAMLWDEDLLVGGPFVRHNGQLIGRRLIGIRWSVSIGQCGI